jgi:tetratricopeptide (TPR) repeat protein
VSRNDLAAAYRVAGRVDEAIALHEAALAECERVLGDTHPDTLWSKNDLAVAYRVAGRLGEAIALHEAAERERERGLGVSHPDTLLSRNDLAAAYRLAGRVDEAILLLESALAGLERVLGPAHPDTVAVRGNLEDARSAASRPSDRLPDADRAEHLRQDLQRRGGLVAGDHQRRRDADRALPALEDEQAALECPQLHQLRQLGGAQLSPRGVLPVG